MNICFQPRQGFVFFSNVNRPDKSRIKFWLAACVMPNYLLKEFTYLHKEEHRLADRLQGQDAVFHRKEPYANKG